MIGPICLIYMDFMKIQDGCRNPGWLLYNFQKNELDLICIALAEIKLFKAYPRWPPINSIAAKIIIRTINVGIKFDHQIFFGPEKNVGPKTNVGPKKMFVLKKMLIPKKMLVP